MADESYIDVCFEESGANLLEHAIEGLFIEILLSGQVCDRRVDATAEILKNHGDLMRL